MTEHRLEQFLPDLERFDMTREQKLELLEELDRIMAHFVYLAFDRSNEK